LVLHLHLPELWVHRLLHHRRLVTANVPSGVDDLLVRVMLDLEPEVGLVDVVFFCERSRLPRLLAFRAEVLREGFAFLLGIHWIDVCLDLRDQEALVGRGEDRLDAVEEVLLADALVNEMISLEGPVRHLRSLIVLDNQ